MLSGLRENKEKLVTLMMYSFILALDHTKVALTPFDDVRYLLNNLSCRY